MFFKDTEKKLKLFVGVKGMVDLRGKNMSHKAREGMQKGFGFLIDVTDGHRFERLG